MAGIIRRYQSEIYGNYRRAGLLYGLATGLLMSLVVFFMYIITLPIQVPESYPTTIALATGTFLFGYLYRRTLPEGKVFFKELILMGIYLGVVASVVYGLFLVLYASVIDTDFISNCCQLYSNNVMNSEQPQEIIDNSIEAFRSYSAWTWGGVGAFRSGVMTILVAFVMALVFKTEKQQVKVKER